MNANIYICFKGAQGSGKTTLMDKVMHLLADTHDVKHIKEHELEVKKKLKWYLCEGCLEQVPVKGNLNIEEVKYHHAFVCTQGY